MGKKKSKTPSKDLKRPVEIKASAQVSGLGHVCLTAIIGSEAADLDNGRILLPPEAFVSSQLGAGELVAIALSNSQAIQEDVLPGLASSIGEKPTQQSSPLDLWHNLEQLQLVPSTFSPTLRDEASEDVAESMAALHIAEQGPNTDRGRPVERAKRSRNVETIHQRSGAPEALQLKLSEGVQGGREASLASLPSGSEKARLPGEALILARAWPGKVAAGQVGLPPSILTSLGGDYSVGKGVLIYMAANQAKVLGRDVRLEWLEHQVQDQVTANAVGAPDAKAPTAVQWLKRVMGQEQGRVKDLVLLSAAWHLHGCLILNGNPVGLPVLGRTVFFRASYQDSEADAWSYVEVDKASKLQILAPNVAESPADPFYSHIQAEAVRAGEVAAEAVGGGLDGPAASSAYQAAQIGVSALATAEDMECIGGFQEQIAQLEQIAILPLQEPEIFEEYGLEPPRGVLLHGPPGTGKTRLAAAIARKAGVSLFVMNGPDVLSGYLGHSEQGIQGVFAAAKASKPAIIFIDEIDALAPVRENGNNPHTSSGNTAASSASARVVLTLAEEMSQADGVSVIAATNLPDSLDAALLRPGRLDVEIEIGVPKPKDREAILRIHMKALKHNLSDEQIEDLAKKAHGFVGADLASLCDEASYTCLRRVIRDSMSDEDEIWVTEEDFRVARDVVRPSALRDITVEIPNVKWEDIGGMETVKQRLRETVEWPQKHADRLKLIGAEVPKGILLYGPPGCSKTMLAKSVATEAGLNFFSVKGGELFSKYVGDSEKAVATLFKRARTNAPSVIFFDEIDGLVGSRDDSSTAGGVENRVIGALLIAMDGLEERGDVVVIAATNRPDILDPALLRPGRFDRLLYVPLPDVEAREQILKVRTKPCPLAGDVNLRTLAETSEGFSGADIANLVREAGMAALDEDIETLDIAARHFDAAFKVVTNSVVMSEETRDIYESFRRSI